MDFLFQTDWRLVSKYACAFTVVSFILLTPIPESPSWLVGKNKLKKAEKALKVIRGIKGKLHFSLICLKNLISFFFCFSH
jgi:hypothetical protein